MKNWKSILITVFSFFAISGMVLFNSCVKDPCNDLRCQNKGTCSDGFCQCPTGFEGSECEITAASRFTGTWVGNYRCNNYPITPDTVRIVLQEAPNTVRFENLGFGNTAAHSFTGTATTPQTTFVDLPSQGSTTHAYMYVDGGLLQVYLQTVDANGLPTQNCHFSGVRISN
ncbi:calcium-binding EGF-like domain-containing protein [Taibaiella lutea]|uniref:Calcium-binding EGF-like domain-containing protein n=1 Tax=Taibaiella lutea TaxID=2608001 RepID=A0A5M6CED9_9BACT|nr:calcium-binding EGF-like domain-containing protein [Taibaiella lutea]KAA5533343.1 calcium-binding EGF-like domain-containing protein [Taibaiella lutea]